MFKICTFSKMLRMFGLLAIGLLVSAVVCSILALALDFWVYFENDTVKINAGIWTVCSEVTTNSNKTCTDVEADGSYNAIRAMLILAIFLKCSAIVCIILKLFVVKERMIPLYIAAASLITAGLFLLVGFAVYRSQIYSSMKDSHHQNLSLHAGFALCVIAWLITWTTAGLTILMFFVEDLD